MNKKLSIKYLAIIVGIIAFFIFIPNLNDGFLSDDYDFLARMDHITNLPTVYEQFNPAGHGFWRPLLNTSFIFNYLVFGENSAFTYHLFNNILHAVISAMILLTTYKIFTNKKLSILAGLLFALYPMHHESVTWIAGRTDVLSAFFFIFALYNAVSYLKEKKLKNHIYALLLFACAILSKEMALSFPLILFIIHLAWFKGDKFKTYFKIYSPYALVLLLYFIGRYLSIGFLLGGYMTFGASTHLNIPILATLVSPSYYFTKILNFTFLSHYPVGFIQTLTAIVFVYKKIILGISIILLLLLQKRKLVKKNILNLSVLYILTILIAGPAWSMLVNIQPDGMDTRFLYFPTIFGSILFAYLLSSIKNKKIFFTISTLVIMLFAFANYINYVPWQKADEIKTEILTKLSQEKSEISENELVYVANLPDHYFGAYIFRNGFAESFENTINDEQVFINYDNKKAWQLKSNDMLGYMCRETLIHGTYFFVWLPDSKTLKNSSDLLSKEKNKQKINFEITEKKSYNELSWNNVLWEGSPEKFVIKFPHQKKSENFLNTCPLWFLTNAYENNNSDSNL